MVFLPRAWPRPEPLPCRFERGRPLRCRWSIWQVPGPRPLSLGREPPRGCLLSNPRRLRPQLLPALLRVSPSVRQARLATQWHRPIERERRPECLWSISERPSLPPALPVPELARPALPRPLELRLARPQRQAFHPTLAERLALLLPAPLALAPLLRCQPWRASSPSRSFHRNQGEPQRRRLIGPQINI